MSPGMTSTGWSLDKILPYSFYQNLAFSQTQSGLGLLSKIKPPGTAWQITARGKAAHYARSGGVSTREPQRMGQTTALARLDYSITIDRRC